MDKAEIRRRAEALVYPETHLSSCGVFCCTGDQCTCLVERIASALEESERLFTRQLEDFTRRVESDHRVALKASEKRAEAAEAERDDARKIAQSERRKWHDATALAEARGEALREAKESLELQARPHDCAGIHCADCGAVAARGIIEAALAGTAGSEGEKEVRRCG